MGKTQQRYPKRESFFSNRFCRFLKHTKLASSIGAEACWLATMIAIQEDHGQYKAPPDFTNKQLMAICGFGEHRLIKARQAAVDAGILKFIPGNRRRPGVYWCVIPETANAEMKTADSAAEGKKKTADSAVFPNVDCANPGTVPPNQQSSVPSLLRYENKQSCAQPEILRSLQRDDDLEDSDLLTRLHRELAASTDWPHVVPGEMGLLNLVTLAEHCRKADGIKKRVGCFVARLKRGDFALNDSEEQRARVRLNGCRRRSAGDSTSGPVAIGSVLQDALRPP